ncbi:MAG: DUF4351 domain-containing protein [Magnetococcales bacterium]|nr:DUF4351 domain-containing protein [Magnetococcales bacterium]
MERILAEIKITQSLNEAALTQASRYDDWYRITAKLKKHQLRTVIISAASARQRFLERFAFQPVGPNGVHESKPTWGEPIRVIFLNELDDSPGNAPLKCFASRAQEREKAFSVVDLAGLIHISTPFNDIMNGLRRTIMHQSLRELDNAGITPDSVMLVGRRMLEASLNMMPREELVAIPKLGELLEIGKQSGEADLLMRLLQRRFGSVPAWMGEMIAKAPIHSLEEWTLRVLDAQSLDEVFADRM